MITVDLVNAENWIPNENDFRIEVVKILRCCCSASTFLASNPPFGSQWNSVRCCSTRYDQAINTVDEPLSRSLQDQIFRYFRVSDQYQSFLSLLLKSREFYLAYHPLYRQSLDLLPVIDLPKTSEGKPFVPSETGKRSSYEFSLSHQSHFLGVARTKGNCIGFDIVVLEDLRNNETEIDYIRSFQNSFGDLEWDAIITSNSKLHEFLLRWCMKESYTKAIGLGLGLNFQSFNIILHGAPKYWWDYVFVSDCNQEYRKTLEATIFHGMNERKGNEDCVFTFIPIFSESQELRGCASICIPGVLKGKDITVSTSWLKIDDLLYWYR
jgi:phosphopantetheinyl transferase